MRQLFAERHDCEAADVAPAVGGEHQRVQLARDLVPGVEHEDERALAVGGVQCASVHADSSAGQQADTREDEDQQHEKEKPDHWRSGTRPFNRQNEEPGMGTAGFEPATSRV